MQRGLARQSALPGNDKVRSADHALPHKLVPLVRAGFSLEHTPDKSATRWGQLTSLVHVNLTALTVFGSSSFSRQSRFLELILSRPSKILLVTSHSPLCVEQVWRPNQATWIADMQQEVKGLFPQCAVCSVAQCAVWRSVQCGGATGTRLVYSA